MKRREFLAAPAAATAVPDTWVATRPRLYFDAAGVVRLRQRIANERGVKDRWDKLIERAKRSLDSRLVPEEIAEEGGGQHANYGRPGGQVSEMGLTLGLAFHVTGEKQYAEKLREALLYYAGYKRWGGQGLADRVPPWHSELNTARFCFGYGAGYDAIHGLLSPADRKTIAGGMVRLGILPTLEDWILPERRIHALDSMGHNWWSVCVSMAGVAALALLGDDDRAPEWVDRVARGLALWFAYRGNVLQNKPANFDPAGAFYEGVNYANYALSEYLRFRLAHGNVFPNRPQPRFAALEKATDFFLHTFYPTARSYLTVNFEDGSLHTRCAETVRLLNETGFAHPCDGWYINKSEPDPQSPLALLGRRPVASASPLRLRQSAIYDEIGWAVLRSSWQDDATLLAVKSGFTWNHSHADAGSFILFHGGVPLIIDSGSCSYSRREYGAYYVQSRAHNVVLFNGQGQPQEDIRRGVKTPGRVHSLLDGFGLKYVYADATGPMSRWFTRDYRHWLWTGGVILVFDDLRAHEEGRFDWLLHYDGTARRDGSRVLVKNGKGAAEVRFLFPQELDVREEQGLADHRPDEKVPYLAFSNRAPAREQKFVVAIVPAGARTLPELEPLSGPEMMGVRLRHEGQITEVYLNLQADGRRMHVNSNNIIDGWETDAYLLAVTHPARYLVSRGSYLRKGGRVLLDSLAKVDALWRAGDDPEIFVQGEPQIEAAIGAERRPRTLKVNGKPARFRWSGGLAEFRA